jgi:hypothetical protein
MLSAPWGLGDPAVEPYSSRDIGAEARRASMFGHSEGIRVL